jgi:hypothetical protein
MTRINPNKNLFKNKMTRMVLALMVIASYTYEAPSTQTVSVQGDQYRL